MNVLNRALIILISIVLLIVSVIILLVTLGAIAPDTIAPNDWFQNRLADFEDLTGTDRNWAIAVSSVVALVSLMLLIIEMLPGRREPSRLIIKQDGHGRVTVALDSVRRLADWEAGQEPDVLEVESQVREEAEELVIRSRVALSPQANAPEVAQVIQERIKDAVEQRVGRQVSQVTVDTQLEPLHGRAERRRVR